MKFFLKCFLPILFAAAFTACSSSNTEKSVPAHPSIPAKPKDALAPDFKFSFFIMGTETGYEPCDTWTMDTTGTMVVETFVTQNGKKHEVHGIATLDPQDMDSLRTMIRFGKLYTIDSADLNEQCGSAEYYAIRLVPLAPVSALSATLDSCAADYNLLLEPQRAYFRRFIDWWERMRLKYRPMDPG